MKQKYSRFKGSLIPSQIVGAVIEGNILKSKKGHGESRALMEGKLNGKNVYTVKVAWWGFDDADEETFVFESKSAAEFCYNHYANFNLENLPESSLYIMTKGDVKKHIPGTEYKGYFVKELYMGDVLQPFWNKDKLNELGLLDTVKALPSDADIRDILKEDSRLKECLIKIGQNEYGVYVVSEDEKRNEEKIIYFKEHKCWETGLTYYQLIGRYDKEVFSVMGLQYHDEELEEEGDWKGWFTFDKNEVNLKLNKIGWSCK